MNEQVPLTWEEYYSKFPKPGKLVLTPEQEAVFDNSPCMKRKNEMCKRDLTEHPLPWGEVIWND